MNIHLRLKPLFLVTFLTIIVTTKFAQAQKAYDNVIYKTKIYGNLAVLTLADGYLPASKVVIYSKQGNRVFMPDVAEPDRKGELRFNATKGTGSYKDNKGSWLVLTGLSGSDVPSRIKAIYWDGKTRKSFVFK